MKLGKLDSLAKGKLNFEILIFRVLIGDVIKTDPWKFFPSVGCV